MDVIITLILLLFVGLIAAPFVLIALAMTSFINVLTKIEEEQRNDKT